MWGQSSPRECKKVMQDMATVVKAMVERLDAELHDDDVNVCLGCFNLEEWSRLRRRPDAHSEALLYRMCDKLARALRLPGSEIRAEFAEALPLCLAERERERDC